jgi:hypothetical protein
MQARAHRKRSINILCMTWWMVENARMSKQSLFACVHLISIFSGCTVTCVVLEIVHDPTRAPLFFMLPHFSGFRDMILASTKTAKMINSQAQLSRAALHGSLQFEQLLPATW